VVAPGADWLKEAARAKRQCRRHRENFIGGLAVSKKQGCFLGAGRYKEVRERSGNAAGIASSSPMVAPRRGMA